MKRQVIFKLLEVIVPPGDHLFLGAFSVVRWSVWEEDTKENFQVITQFSFPFVVKPSSSQIKDFLPSQQKFQSFWHQNWYPGRPLIINYLVFVPDSAPPNLPEHLEGGSAAVTDRVHLGAAGEQDGCLICSQILKFFWTPYSCSFTVQHLLAICTHTEWM